MITYILPLVLSMLILFTGKFTQDTQLLFNGISLDGWKIIDFMSHENVFISDSSIIVRMSPGVTGIRWIKDFPMIKYEVSLEAKRIEGDDFFCGLTFPVKESFCTLVVGGWGGSLVGLSCVDGEDAANNNTSDYKNFVSGRWYIVRLKVTDEKIEAWIDGEKIVDFTIGDHTLFLRSEVESCKPFGIATWQTTAALRNIKLNRISE